MENSMTEWVVGSIVPILPSELSVNQGRPPGPTTISCGSELSDREYSVKSWETGSIDPILPAKYSVNQIVPSGPVAIPPGPESGLGIGYSWMAWTTTPPGNFRATGSIDP